MIEREAPPAAATGRRALPVLDVPMPAPPLTAREATRPSDERLVEFRTEDLVLPRFFVWTLGCQMNKSDSEEMAGHLLAAGCSEALSFEAADLIVINTCAIREQAELKVVGRQGQLARLKDANPQLRVVLTGCSVREGERHLLAKRYPAVDLFLRPDEEPELVGRLGLASAQASLGLGGASVWPVESSSTAVVGQRTVGAADHLPATRAAAVTESRIRRSSDVSAWIPIVYGCDKTCTYCIVPFSRGPERSRAFDDIVDEARSLSAQGFREVTLLGQNVNSYGHDLPAEPRFGHISTERSAGRRIDLRSRPDLAELLRTIDGLRAEDGAPAIPRLRFITSHPWDLSDRLVEAMAECPSVCEHLHLPIQSGDDAMLRRMGRQYTVEHYLERLGTIRAAVPGIALTTDVIVGFCGETETQFEATLEVLERVEYDTVFAAAYSPRPGTPAERLPDDVPPGEKRRRLNELLARQEGISLRRNVAWVGRTVEVLVDGIDPPRAHSHDADEPGTGDAPSVPPERAGEGSSILALAGRSRENKLVHFAGPGSLLGSLVRVTVEHAGPYSLRGRLA